MTEAYKFQKLKVYQMALGYTGEVYDLCHQLPDGERFNLQSQLQRAATSIVLNIAEGSTGQSDAEQYRFLSHALRSYLETVACFDLIEQQNYLPQNSLCQIRDSGHQLFIKLQSFRKNLKGRKL
jgi:four helix bundle protein